MLSSAKLPPKCRRAAGEAITMRRWRQAVATMDVAELPGSVWMRAGKRYADAIPTTALRVAA